MLDSSEEEKRKIRQKGIWNLKPWGQLSTPHFNTRVGSTPMVTFGSSLKKETKSKFTLSPLAKKGSVRGALRCYCLKWECVREPAVSQGFLSFPQIWGSSLLDFVSYHSQSVGFSFHLIYSLPTTSLLIKYSWTLIYLMKNTHKKQLKIAC